MGLDDLGLGVCPFGFECRNRLNQLLPQAIDVFFEAVQLLLDPAGARGPGPQEGEIALQENQTALRRARCDHLTAELLCCHALPLKPLTISEKRPGSPSSVTTTPNRRISAF